VVDYHESSNLISHIEEKGIERDKIHNSTRPTQRHDTSIFENTKSMKKLLERPPIKSAKKDTSNKKP
jgi:hypothetical protein